MYRSIEKIKRKMRFLFFFFPPQGNSLGVTGSNPSKRGPLRPDGTPSRHYSLSATVKWAGRTRWFVCWRPWRGLAGRWTGHRNRPLRLNSRSSTSPRRFRGIPGRWKPWLVLESWWQLPRWRRPGCPSGWGLRGGGGVPRARGSWGGPRGPWWPAPPRRGRELPSRPSGTYRAKCGTSSSARGFRTPTSPTAAFGLPCKSGACSLLRHHCTFLPSSSCFSDPSLSRRLPLPPPSASEFPANNPPRMTRSCSLTRRRRRRMRWWGELRRTCDGLDLLPLLKEVGRGQRRGRGRERESFFKDKRGG